MNNCDEAMYIAKENKINFWKDTTVILLKFKYITGQENENN